MTLLIAALSTAVFVYFAVGFLTGTAPDIKFRSREKTYKELSDGQLWLIQAGLDLSPRQFWGASAAAGLMVFVAALLFTDTPAVAFPLALIVVAIPRGFYGRRRSQRLAEVQNAWPDGLRLLMGSIAAGSSLAAALNRLSTEGPEALRNAFQRFPLTSRMLGVAPALQMVREEIADATTDRIIEVLMVAHERGGQSVMSILRDLANSTNKDLRVLEEIRSESLESRINAGAVFVIPWLILVLLTARTEMFREFYSTDHAVGVVVVFIGAVLSGIGILIVSRLSRSPIEARVLTGSRPAQAGEPNA
ncbi:MAG: hypothetical protein HKO63_06080 [Acidimicrobiia bacterium]|nr:hypothetical protein [Acidimicrobiia bacterium]